MEIAVNKRSIGLPAGVWLLALTQRLFVVDHSVVTVALPGIREDLGFSPATLSWVITGYSLALGGLVLVSGRIGAMIGPRRALMVGVTLFVLASAFGGLAQDPTVLVAARVAQGAGAAFAAPSVLLLITAITAPGPQRTKAMSVFVVAIGGGISAGVVLGGWLTDTFGWRATMFVGVPVGAVVLSLVRRLVPEQARSAARLDVAGAAASTIGMTAAVFGLVTAADTGWSDGRVVLSFAVAATALVALMLVERRHRAPVVPPVFFASLRAAAPFAGMFLVPAGQFGVLYFSTLLLQDVWGFTPLSTGLAILPFTAALLASNLTTPKLVERLGERTVGTAGMSGVTIGLLWLSTIGPDSGFLDALLGPLLVLGAGVGLTIAPLTAVLMSRARPDQVPAASSLNQAAQQLGGATGLAVLTTVFAAAGGPADVRSIGTALAVAAAFPALALIVFALRGRPGLALRTTGSNEASASSVGT